MAVSIAFLYGLGAVVPSEALSVRVVAQAPLDLEDLLFQEIPAVITSTLRAQKVPRPSCLLIDALVNKFGAELVVS